MAGEHGEDFQYDVCLSFAGEQRDYVDQVAAALRGTGVRVFYDDYEKVQLWGKDLYEHLDFVYREAARYCVLFVSREYARKLWTSHERRSAQARAFEENHEYILPARFDDTEVPGLRPTIGYVSLNETTPEELAGLIKEKIGRPQRDNFFPPVPDALFKELDISDEGEREAVAAVAYKFFQSLQRMTPDERRVVHAVLLRGCDAELPENIHISLDLLRREVGMPASQVLEILRAVDSLGFRTTLRDAADSGPHVLTSDDKMVVLDWHHLTDAPIEESIGVARAVVWTAAHNYCEEHAVEAFLRLNFSALASATVKPDAHEQRDEHEPAAR